MNKRSITMAAAVLAVALFAGIGPAQAKPKAKTTTITVRGDWLNDLNCVPLSPPTVAGETVNIECDGSSAWGGDFTGREIAHLHGTVEASGRMHGTYKALFIGTYLGDNSHGALNETGYFSVDEKGAFLARATITGGTCDWVGSRGTIAFDGLAVNGGYVGQWKRPAVPPPSDPTCNPVNQLP